MKIEYLGHSCFKLTESTGTSVITDPYANIGYDMPSICSDLVTCSHNHYDHNHIKGVNGNPHLVKGAKTFEQNGITISGVKSYHDDAIGKQRGENMIFKFRMDGVNICHLGDIGYPCNSDLTELLLPINVLLIPVGGVCTIDAAEAYEYVQHLMPDIVIPMHYKTKSLDMDINKLSDFLDFFEEDAIEILSGTTLEVDREDINSSETRVVVLKRMKSN